MVLRRLPRDPLPALFLGGQALREGVLTRHELRGGDYVRVVRGVYARSGTRVTHATRARVTGLLLPPGAVITGRSAAVLRGAPVAWDEDPVEVLVSEGARRRLPHGTTVRRSLRPVEPDPGWTGTPLATPRRMAFDLAARWEKPLGVAHLDAVARRGLVDLDELRRWAATAHDRDVVPVRAAAALADPRSESLPESQVRVHLVEAGIAVVPQVEVRDAQGVVLRADLVVEGLRVVVLYDGAWHALRTQLERDRQQLRRLADAGYQVVHVTAAQLRDPAGVVMAVRAAVARASR
jgi:very-short-patch-repair endonuclease